MKKNAFAEIAKAERKHRSANLASISSIENHMLNTPHKIIGTNPAPAIS
jgi:hypothetical protein